MWRKGAAAATTTKAALLASKCWRRCSSRALSSLPPNTTATTPRTFSSPAAFSQNLGKPPPLLSLKLFSSSSKRGDLVKDFHSDETEEEGGSDDGWEEEEEVESKMGDGGDGGGVVLRDVVWGERALSVARDVLLQFGDDIALFAFKVNPTGYIYLRIDKLTDKYGCPSMEEVEDFCNLYKKRLDELEELGELPDDLAIEVSSPGAERLVKIPEDLDRFKDMTMWVLFVEENPESEQQQESEKVLLLDSFDAESEKCVWRLANVRENRDVQSKGRPLSRKQRDWRLTLPFDSVKKVKLYLDTKAK